MSSASKMTIQALEFIVKTLPVGTNLALLQVLWALLSGAFLHSRGALFPALLHLGLSAVQVRRGSQAVRDGAWTSETLLKRWRTWQAAHTAWRPDEFEGYRPLAVDITAFWRPQLQGWRAKFFNHLANRALKAIGFGLVVEVGHNGAQRLPLLKYLLCATDDTQNESQFKAQVLAHVSQHLGPTDVAVHDAGASLADMHTAKMKRFVVRLDRNCTARRNQLPASPVRRGRPAEYGALVRPLARTYKGRPLPATPADVTTQFTYQGRIIKAQGWCDVVRSEQKVAADNPRFTIWVYADPLYQTPLVLGTNLAARPATIFQLYLARWPVEEVPLVCKQLLGLQHQFVCAALARFRLPELGLIAANILAHVAAELPAQPTGFWDRQPQRTPGRLCRVLAQVGFPTDYPLDGRIREKQAVTAHLPKGVAAHRRHKASGAVPAPT
ncbi:MAG: hypothetical protein N2508_01205 [Anaerolineae bacterium]|nr:hypothetical protein [Anaerolineae bacterium]